MRELIAEPLTDKWQKRREQRQGEAMKQAQRRKARSVKIQEASSRSGYAELPVGHIHHWFGVQSHPSSRHQ